MADRNKKGGVDVEDFIALMREVGLIDPEADQTKKTNRGRKGKSNNSESNK